MAITALPDKEIDQLRKLRKKRMWRQLIELGNHILAQPGQIRAAGVHAEIAKAYIEVRQYELARKHLIVAQKLKSKNIAVLRRYGELEFALGNYEAATKHWKKVVKAKEKKASRADRSLYLNLAKAQRNLGQLKSASRTARCGFSHFPKNLKLARELARISSMISSQTENSGEVGDTAISYRTHPYRGLDSAAYWNQTVSPKNCLEINNWYRKKFSINGLSISSAGSCFAQHIGRALRENGYEYVDAEPAPNFLRPESHHDYGYGIYSARFGNIYTSRQLLQLLQQSLGLIEPEDLIWPKDDGYVDALRPTIEPEPHVRPEEIANSRKYHLDAVKRMFKNSNLFIFTMGLTETWVSNSDGTVYPVAPGVSGGAYDPKRYSFKNLTYPEVLEDMEEFIRLVRQLNPTLKIIFTVSPVPLMATAAADNVIVSSSYSKSVLRSVAGYLKSEYDFIDYFPSFEIVGSHVMRGQFFNPDGRTVSPYGVSHVMKQFFSEHVPPILGKDKKPDNIDPDDVVCDEELLNEFGPS